MGSRADFGAEVTGLAGDLGGVAGFVRQEPRHDLGTGLAAKEGAELEEKVARMIHSRRNGKAAIPRGAAQPAVGEEIRI